MSSNYWGSDHVENVDLEKEHWKLSNNVKYFDLTSVVGAWGADWSKGQVDQSVFLFLCLCHCVLVHLQTAP